MHFVGTLSDKLARLEQNSRSKRKKRWRETRLFMELYRSTCRSNYYDVSSICFSITLPPVTLENVVCMIQCEGTTTGREWLLTCTKLLEVAKLVPKRSQTEAKTPSKAFPCNGAVRICRNDILGVPPKKTKSNQHVVIITHRNSKPTRAVYTARTTMTAVV